MAKKETLLDKAKLVSKKQRTVITDEVVDVAVAWAKEEITTTQAMCVLGPKNIYNILAFSLKIYVKKNG